MSNPFLGANLFTVHGVDGKTKVEIDVDNVLKINEGDLLEELSKLARYYSYFSNLYANADSRANKYEMYVKAMIGKKAKDIRIELEGKEKITAKLLEEIIDQDLEILELRKTLIEKQEEVKKLIRLCKAIELKERSIKHFIDLMKSEWFMEFSRSKENVIGGMINTGKYKEYMKMKEDEPEEITREDDN